MRRSIQVGLMLVSAAAATACDESLSKIAGPTPNLSPSFASVQQQIFETADSANRPACVNCHSAQGRTPSGGLNLDHAVAYDQLVNVPSREHPELMRIAPGNPDGSYLVHKVEGRGSITGARMPLRGPYLTDGQILILRRWIAIGAPRD